MGYNARNDEIRDNVTRMRREWEAQRAAPAKPAWRSASTVLAVVIQVMETAVCESTRDPDASNKSPKKNVKGILIAAESSKKKTLAKATSVHANKTKIAARVSNEA
jgi:hypothetical protein